MIPYLSELTQVEDMQAEAQKLVDMLEDFSEKIDSDMGDKALRQARWVVKTLSSLNQFMTKAVEANSTEEEIENAKKSFDYKYHRISEEDKKAVAKVSAALVGRDHIDSFSLGMYKISKEDVMLFCDMFGLTLEAGSHGTWSWIYFSKDGEKLNFDDLVAMGATYRRSDLVEENPDEEIDSEESDDVSLGFGWLAPDGTFYESSFGTHEEEAQKIVDKYNWNDHYLEVSKTKNGEMYLCRDYICYERGYVLIHNPYLGSLGEPLTQIGKKLTKKQREFLYDYYAKDYPVKAKAYLEEE